VEQIAKPALLPVSLLNKRPRSLTGNGDAQRFTQSYRYEYAYQYWLVVNLIALPQLIFLEQSWFSGREIFIAAWYS
jgi:hypothetical protein